MIEVRNLSKVFALSNGAELRAVDDLNFRVGPGEVYGLLGPNGAGKTTTLRMLLGLLAPTSGHATISGFRSDEFPDEVKRRVGLVSSSAGVYQYQSVREMLRFFADLYGVSPERAAKRLDYLSDLLGMGSFLDQRCVGLSTGQRQRVNLARALIHDPAVMLLDEPTLGLDVLGSQTVIEYVRTLQKVEKSIILCTNRLDEAERVCTRIGMLSHGRLAAEGTLEELREITGKTTLAEMFLAAVGAANASGSLLGAMPQ